MEYSVNEKGKWVELDFSFFVLSVFMAGRLFDPWRGDTNDCKNCNRVLPVLHQYLDLDLGR